MNKELIIATSHSENFDKKRDKKITIKLEGGSPWFKYIWIDDDMYTITKGRNAKLERIK